MREPRFGVALGRLTLGEVHRGDHVVLRVGTIDFDTAGTDDSEFRFVGIAGPDRVVAAVDVAQREAAARA